jgi:hypothetical protein
MMVSPKMPLVSDTTIAELLPRQQDGTWPSDVALMSHRFGSAFIVRNSDVVDFYFTTKLASSAAP